MLSFDILQQEDFLACRLVCRDMTPVATSFVFRHVRLEAIRVMDGHFMNIALSPSLRDYVREVTCDTWVGGRFVDHVYHPYLLLTRFAKHLPCLRLFRNLHTLHLRFSPHCAKPGRSTSTYALEESTVFRYSVLDTVFRCLDGTWSAKEQEKIDSDLRIHGGILTSDYHVPDDDAFVDGPIPIHTLTIANLADYNDTRLTKSAAFQNVINSGNLRDLKLLIATGRNITVTDPTIHYRDRQNMYESLPTTWLSPGLAQHLRVLSLYGAGYWGWHPKMDFRLVNPTGESGSGFPNLKVLALGKYVFSHEWQIDWIANLGKNNRNGGLEELYLDNCPILACAAHPPPMDTSTTNLGLDADGKEIIISNHGYPRPEAEVHDYQVPGETDHAFCLRWCDILTRWQDTMPSLKVFKADKESWTIEKTDHATPMYGIRPERELLAHRRNHNEFRNYNCPSPPEERALAEKYMGGCVTLWLMFRTPLVTHPEFPLHYVKFDRELNSSALLGLSRYSPVCDLQVVSRATRELDMQVCTLFLANLGHRVKWSSLASLWFGDD